MADLALNDVILEPVMDTEECPETLLEVKDSEVPFERFITKEEQAKIDEQKKKDEGKTDSVIMNRSNKVRHLRAWQKFKERVSHELSYRCVLMSGHSRER